MVNSTRRPANAAEWLGCTGRSNTWPRTVSLTLCVPAGAPLNSVIMVESEA